MKRVRVKFLAPNEFEREDFLWRIKGVLEVEEYKENPISKDPDVIQEHSFEELLESTMQFANGIWSALKGFFGMSKWAIVVMMGGLKWMWDKGVGSDKAKKEKKVNAK
jgi:hypothetical protein